MGRATEELKREHEEIRAMMRVLRRMAADATSGRPVPQGDLDAAISYFEIVADRIHHSKEEEVLVPALTGKGYPLKGGPLCTYFRSLEIIRIPMRDEVRETSSALGETPPESPDAPIPILEEHQLGRNLVRLMKKAASPAEFARRAERFLEMLDEHIHKEDHCLFPMTDDTLTPAEDEEVLAKFHEFDRKVADETGLARFRPAWDLLIRKG
jgi:hemerythrin-like domain-containing protein